MTDTFARRGAIKAISAAAAMVPVAARAADPASRISWLETTSDTPGKRVTAPVFGPAPTSLFGADATVMLDKPGRTVAGFGGAFSEKGWQALSVLPEKARSAALDALFGSAGCNFSLCRTPLGANDISRGWYSYDETPGDFALAQFSVANDHDTLLPFIKAAQQLQPKLQRWASQCI